jgi:type IV pilus biogenesis protein CpaD/CtpE
MTFRILCSGMMAAVSVLALSACAQNTPSMMNENKPRLIEQTQIDHIPMKDMNDTVLAAVAENYRRYGEGTLDLTVTYDPKSKTYTAMKAVNDLAHMADVLRVKGISDIKTNTLPAPGTDPMLAVHYDSVSALGPKDCAPMPGMDDYTTGRNLDSQYLFGCGIETQLARQIYRPADLRGNGTVETGDGRRAVSVSETYRAQQASEVRGTLQQWGRSDLSE